MAAGSKVPLLSEPQLMGVALFLRKRFHCTGHDCFEIFAAVAAVVEEGFVSGSLFGSSENFVDMLAEELSWIRPLCKVEHLFAAAAAGSVH